MNSQSKVTIGMPIFNESRFLKESLDSIVAQNYPNIELVISDNASTDDTKKIVEDYVNAYDWISYKCQSENIGAYQNFVDVMINANGKYFMWAAGHDLWSANLISDCVSQLESNSDAIIAYSASTLIDENGSKLIRQLGWTDTRGLSLLERFNSILWGNMNPIMGVIRTDSLQKCSIPNIIGCDLVMLTWLALRGDFVTAIDSNWSRREFRKEQSHSEKVKRYQSKEFGFSNKMLPLLHLPIELFKNVLRAECSLGQKLLLIGSLVVNLPLRYIAGKTKKS